MICEKCQTIVPEENAVYCSTCGARLDGKKPCPSCGEYIEETYTYCVYCGARADGKTACPACGTYHAGAFCPDCGAQLSKKQEALQSKSKKKEAVPAEKKQKIWNTVFAWIRSGAGLACAVFALIFVWFIGFTLKMTGTESLLSSFGVSAQETNLFYFFGDVYKELAELKTAETFKSGIPLAAGYIYGISGTVISVLTLGCVAGFASFAIVGFVRFAVYGEENKGAKMGVAAALSFLGGAALLYALNAVSLDVASSDGTEKISANLSVAYNGAATAGIILCAIFLAIYAAGNLVRKGAAWRQKKTIITVVLSVVAAVFGAVVYSVAKGAFVGIQYTSAGASIGIAYSQFTGNVFLISITELAKGVRFYNEHLSSIGISFVFSVLQQFAVLATVGCGVGYLFCKVLGSEGDQPKGAFGLAIAMLCCMVAQLVFGIISQTAVGDIFAALGATAGETVKAGVQVGAGVVGVVFALLCLGSEIAKRCVQKSND